jgi:hypothetical protein
MHGFNATLKRKSRRRQYRSARRQFRHGQRAAALRAATGARLLAVGAVPSLALAASWVGSNVAYVQAMATLLKSENTPLLERVLAGDMPVLAAAVQTKRLADLVDAYRRTDSSDHIAFLRTCGTDRLLNELAEAAS